jgi:NOL1/NOP2/fmu family ribosome biogenesis protein
MLGISLGAYKGQDFIPHHHLSMAQISLIPYENVEVDIEVALQYLRRSNLPSLPGKGWITLNFNGLRLGFLKNLTNRSNNYYPNEWRILNY